MWAGAVLSGLGHAMLITLAIETLPWLQADDAPPPEVIRVTLLTPADLAALSAPPEPAAPAAAVPTSAPAPAAAEAVVSSPPPSAVPATVVPAPDRAPPEAEAESLAPGFDAAAPLGMAAADDPATAALAADIEPDLAATPLPVPEIRSSRPRPRHAPPPPPAPEPEPAPQAEAPAPAPEAPRTMPSVVVGPIFIDAGQSAGEPVLRPNLPPAPGADVSTYVPPLMIPGDSPALRRPPAGADQAALAAYQAAIREAVLAAETYPPEAQTRGVEGTAGLKVIVRRDGRLVTAILVRSTGSSTLDRASLDAVRRAVLPAAPPQLAGDRFAVEVSVAFFLAGAPPDAGVPLPPDGG